MQFDLTFITIVEISGLLKRVALVWFTLNSMDVVLPIDNPEIADKRTISGSTY